ncbi:hypothetical protein K431DRAFT_194606, partial [Polychaeton citri CBS 116435]
LLVLDSHSSHIIGRFIVFCREHNIELLILPPHTSYILQPLDISCFSPLKVEQRLGFNQIQTPLLINNLVNIDALDKSLLDLLPPEATELHIVNLVFLSRLDSLQLPKTPIKRYAKRVTRQLELRCSDVVIRKTYIKKLESALRDTKVRRNTKRVALEGKFIYTTNEVIEITQKAK